MKLIHIGDITVTPALQCALCAVGDGVLGRLEFGYGKGDDDYLKFVPLKTVKRMADMGFVAVTGPYSSKRSTVRLTPGGNVALKIVNAVRTAERRRLS